MENFFLYALISSFLTSPLLFLLMKQKVEGGSAVKVIVLYSSFFFIYNLLFDNLERNLGGRLYYLIYTLIEFSAFCFLIIKSEESRLFKKYALVIGVFFVGFCIFRYTIKQDERMDSYEIAFETLAIISLIIYFFYLRFKQVDEQYLYQNPNFWLMTGMLVYLGFTFFFNILVNHVDNEVIKNYYHYSYVGDIIKNMLFAVALFYMPRRSGLVNPAKAFNAPNLDLI